MVSLIVGGAGYIGAHVAQTLLDANEDVIVVDDLSTGDRRRLPSIDVHELDITEPGSFHTLSDLIGSSRVDTVYHFAALKDVDESFRRPLDYYRLNVEGTRTVVDASAAGGATTLIYSSSAAVYGEGRGGPVSEADPTSPMNPYGRSKLAGEWIVNDAARENGLRAANLRYFNVAGASSALLADRHSTTLVPHVLRELAIGRPPVINGTDYPTSDGTCVRDFIHVADLARAHIHVARALRERAPGALTLNVGTGVGVSVRTMVDLAREVTGTLNLDPIVAPRRVGDPVSVVADATRIAELGWASHHSVRDMIQSTWLAMVSVSP